MVMIKIYKYIKYKKILHLLITIWHVRIVTSKIDKILFEKENKTAISIKYVLYLPISNIF